jgi:hypothetical protein
MFKDEGNSSIRGKETGSENSLKCITDGWWQWLDAH